MEPKTAASTSCIPIEPKNISYSSKDTGHPAREHRAREHQLPTQEQVSMQGHHTAADEDITADENAQQAEQENGPARRMYTKSHPKFAVNSEDDSASQAAPGAAVFGNQAAGTLRGLDPKQGRALWTRVHRRAENPRHEEDEDVRRLPAELPLRETPPGHDAGSASITCATSIP